MGLFSGGNSSSQNLTENTEINTTLSTDIQRDSAFQDSGGVLALAGDSNFTNIEILDAGAVDSAFEFANESQMFWGENFNSVLNTVERSNAMAFDFVEDSFQRTGDITTESLEKVAQANANSVDAQRNLITAFADKDNLEKTAGLSSMILPGMFLIGGYFLVKALKG